MTSLVGSGIHSDRSCTYVLCEEATKQWDNGWLISWQTLSWQGSNTSQSSDNRKAVKPKKTCPSKKNQYLTPDGRKAVKPKKACPNQKINI